MLWVPAHERRKSSGRGSGVERGRAGHAVETHATAFLSCRVQDRPTAGLNSNRLVGGVCEELGLAEGILSLDQLNGPRNAPGPNRFTCFGAEEQHWQQKQKSTAHGWIIPGMLSPNWAKSTDPLSNLAHRRRAAGTAQLPDRWQGNVVGHVCRQRGPFLYFDVLAMLDQPNWTEQYRERDRRAYLALALARLGASHVDLGVAGAEGFEANVQLAALAHHAGLLYIAYGGQCFGSGFHNYNVADFEILIEDQGHGIVEGRRLRADRLRELQFHFGPLPQHESAFGLRRLLLMLLRWARRLWH